MVEARHVGMLAADAAIVARRRPVQGRHEPARMEAHLFTQVAADDVAAVADAIGMLRRRGVEQDARGVDAACAHHDDLAEHLPLRTGLAIEVLDTLRQAVVVHQHAGDDGVGADLELAGLQGIGQQVVGRAEERRRIAAAPAVAAVMAGRKAVVRHGLDRATDPHERHLQPCAGARERDFAAPHLRRRQEVLAARQRVVVVVAAADPDQLIDLVVVRRDVAVVDRPRDVPAVTLTGTEIQLAVAQADASPDVGLAAEAPHPDQLEVAVLGCQPGLFLRVEHERRRLLAARATRPRVPRRHVRPELRPVELLAGIEQHHVDALAREVPRRHAAGGTGTDDDDGIDLRAWLDHGMWTNAQVMPNAERRTPDAEGRKAEGRRPPAKR